MQLSPYQHFQTRPQRLAPTLHDSRQVEEVTRHQTHNCRTRCLHRASHLHSKLHEDSHSHRKSPNSWNNNLRRNESERINQSRVIWYRMQQFLTYQLLSKLLGQWATIIEVERNSRFRRALCQQLCTSHRLVSVRSLMDRPSANSLAVTLRETQT